MAFLDTSTERVVVNGVCPVSITLAGTVYAGDPLGYSTGWKLSASATTIQPLLIAGQHGKTGDIITAYPAGVVRCLVATAATLGELTAVSDAGLYASAGSNTPDVGIVASITTALDYARVIACPMIAQLTVPRS